MGTRHAPGYCHHCGRTVLAVANTPSHVLHLLLSVVTAGLWIPVWIVIALATDSRGRCPDCGNTTEYRHSLAPAPR